MTTVSKKLLPNLNSNLGKLRNIKFNWINNDLTIVMSAYGIRLIILTCLSPFLTILPALAFKLAHDTHSIIGYILAILMLIPWLIVPTLFIQHITSHSRFGKIASYVYAGVLLMTFLLWITIIKF
ncbi:hypothetical protein [Sutcliffiella horikoshii]|uniref:hypothetical protein n=1 Tax=Sutcliffiella horikoshii TaxID=79883 RepID=UPI00384AB2CD